MELYQKSVLEKLGFEQIREATLKKAQSVYSAELIGEMHPSNSLERVQVLLAQTNEMMDLLRDPEAFPLDQLPDIRPHLSDARAIGSIIPLFAFVDILKICFSARLVKRFIKTREEHKPKLFTIAGELIPLKELENYIKGKITESGDLRDDASPELQRIRKRLNSKRNELRSTINKLMRTAVKDGMAENEGATIRNGRMVIPVLAEYKRQIQGFIHDVSSTGQTVYLEPVEVLHLNNEIRQFEAEEQQEIERILQELTAHVRTHTRHILQDAEILGELDVIAAKAKVSISLEGSIPITSENGYLKLKEAYNPNLKLKNLGVKKEDRLDIIPLFLELLEEEKCLMITGPNAGGKSVAMKTVGICALMNQTGYAIPVDPGSELPVFAQVFVDLGDDQSIENDLSTFSSRLKWMKETQDYLLPNSLILIDEAGAGTDPDEGSALFQAFIEYVLNYDCTILVTTHHGALKVFAHEHPKAVNGSMEFDQQHLSPTYRFKKGIPGSSYAFEIAERMKVNSSLLTRSRELLGESKNR
ncbi:MAG: endonuclease MutS2, partial [Balneolales bacterium]|nr:endonuclease MutS2 [Balneolales bacterium]